MLFNISKCKVMHIGKNNLGYRYKMNNQEMEEIHVEKDLGINITDDLKVSNQCLQAYTKASKILGMINRTIVNKNSSILVKLYKSLVRLHLEYSSVAWSPHYKKDKEKQEKIQHRFTRMIVEVRKLNYEERINRSDLIEVFKMHRGLSDVRFDQYFEIDADRRTRGHSAKIKKHLCR